MPIKNKQSKNRVNQTDEAKNLRYLKFFLIIVFICAAVSLSYKVFLTFTQSSFKYGTFNLIILSQDSYYVRINIEQKKISILKFKNQNKFDSRLPLSLALGVPVDGAIISKDKSLVNQDKNFMDNTTAMNLLFNQNTAYDGINWIDILKLYFATKQISQADRDFEVADKIDDLVHLADNDSTDFLDSQIFNEKRSIEIINATGINGLGTKLSSILKYIGYNVVSINSGEEKTSELLSQHTSVSLKRLNSLLDLPSHIGSKSAISDITIILGDDLGRKLSD